MGTPEGNVEGLLLVEVEAGLTARTSSLGLWRRGHETSIFEETWIIAQEKRGLEQRWEVCQLVPESQRKGWVTTMDLYAK